MSLWRAVLRGTADGQVITNVMHLESAGGSEQGVADDIRNAWQDRILPLLHSSYTFQEAEVWNALTDDVAAVSVATTPNVGGGGSTPLPTFVCASIRLNTGRRGRSGQGRLGLSPISEAATGASGNTLDSTAAAAFSTQLTAFRSDLASSGKAVPLELVVVSYEVKGVKRAEPLVSRVTSMGVNSVLGSRLSRHPRR